MFAQAFVDVIDKGVLFLPTLLVLIGIVNGLFKLKNHIEEIRANRRK